MGSGAATTTLTCGGDGARSPVKDPIRKLIPSEELLLDVESLLAFPVSMISINLGPLAAALPGTGGLDGTGSSSDNGRFDFFVAEADFFLGKGTDNSEEPKDVLWAPADGGGGFMSKEVLKWDAEGGGSEGWGPKDNLKWDADGGGSIPNESFIADADGGGPLEPEERCTGRVKPRLGKGREPNMGVGEMGESKLMEAPIS